MINETEIIRNIDTGSKVNPKLKRSTKMGYLIAPAPNVVFKSLFIVNTDNKGPHQSRHRKDDQVHRQNLLKEAHVGYINVTVQKIYL